MYLDDHVSFHFQLHSSPSQDYALLLSPRIVAAGFCCRLEKYSAGAMVLGRAQRCESERKRRLEC